MAELSRRDRLVVLLETRSAWVPAPRSQFGSFGAVPGEKATERKACRSCDETGLVNGRTGQESCPKCDGAGWYLVDGYTGKREDPPREVAVLAGPEREQWRRQTDAKIARLDLQLASPSEVSARTLQDETPERWERERDRHYRHGDYRALDLALEHHAGAVAQLATWTFEYRILEIAHNTELAKAAYAAVDLLNLRMPDPIRVPHWYLPTTDATAKWKAASAARRAA